MRAKKQMPIDRIEYLKSGGDPWENLGAAIVCQALDDWIDLMRGREKPRTMKRADGATIRIDCEAIEKFFKSDWCKQICPCDPMIIWSQRYHIMRRRIVEEKVDRQKWRKKTERARFGNVKKWRRVLGGDEHHKIFEAVVQNRKMPNAKPVYCVELDRTFPSGRAASYVTGLSQSLISSRARGKTNNTDGLHFVYLNAEQTEKFWATKEGETI